MKQITTTIALALCLALGSVACSEEDGTMAGRDAGAEDDGGGGTPDDPRCPTTCVSCADVLAYGCDPATICPDDEPTFGALFNCVCAGACSGPCEDNACVGEPLSPDCQACVGASCADEAAACAAP